MRTSCCCLVCLPGLTWDSPAALWDWGMRMRLHRNNNYYYWCQGTWDYYFPQGGLLQLVYVWNTDWWLQDIDNSLFVFHKFWEKNLDLGDWSALVCILTLSHMGLEFSRTHAFISLLVMPWLLAFICQQQLWYWPHNLTHLHLDKMATIPQTTSSNVFPWMKSRVFWFKFLWSLFLRVQLTMSQHWFR